LLKQFNKESKIIIPDEVERYLVAHIGPEVKLYKKGDDVLYDNGRKFFVKDEEYVLTDEENIVLCLK